MFNEFMPWVGKYVVLMCGAGSGKSVVAAQKVLMLTMQRLTDFGAAQCGGYHAGECVCAFARLYGVHGYWGRNGRSERFLPIPPNGFSAGPKKSSQP